MGKMSMTMKHGDASATELKRVISREQGTGFFSHPTFSATEKSEVGQLPDFSPKKTEMTEF